MGRGYKNYTDNTKRDHDQCIVAVHKETHKMFGGKAAGTNVGYSKIGPLKSAIRYSGRDPEDYYYVSLAFREHGVPELTKLEGGEK